MTPINKFSDFRVLNFNGLELLIGAYTVPGEYAVRKRVNTIKKIEGEREAEIREEYRAPRLYYPPAHPA